jgi:hypothetical protein
MRQLDTSFGPHRFHVSGARLARQAPSYTQEKNGAVKVTTLEEAGRIGDDRVYNVWVAVFTLSCTKTKLRTLVTRYRPTQASMYETAWTIVEAVGILGTQLKKPHECGYSTWSDQSSCPVGLGHQAISQTRRD